MTDDPVKRVLDELALGAEKRWGLTSLFTYLECPECEFDMVLAAADIGPGMKVACPLCHQDTFRAVAMTERPATDADKPEGPDSRYAPLDHFTCKLCGRECISTVPPSEAQAEFEEIYHEPFDPKKHPAICHDCHLVRLAGLRK